MYIFIAAVPSREQLQQVVTVSKAVAKTRVAVSETRSLFEKRILEEQRQVTQTHVNDDWFVLLDRGLKESGIFYLTCFNPLVCSSSHISTLYCSIKCLLTSAVCLQDALSTCDSAYLQLSKKLTLLRVAE